ncbi:sugar ABC transporter permease [Jiangella ureilytica]|uniref:Sugar ABC transporter permease n=1 Tax=Jiangella ureilytica TaxID=2530374 RepID=A0A4R4RBT5_9ACTN|nr:sugar ABC transporter permease [Jiangella ureilytica]
MARRRRRRLAPYVFVAPYALFLVGFGIAPAVYGFYTSLFTDDTDAGTTFAPLTNWGEVLTDYRLADSARNVATYVALWLPSMLVLIFAIALVLHARPGRFAAAMRLVYYVPGAITGSAAALLWLFMVSPQVSPFSPLLDLLGVENATEAVSGNTPLILALMGIAIHAGGWILIVYAALAALPRDVLEAAVIDGASSWQVAMRVKFPMVSRYAALILIATFAAGTQVFVEPTVLATGVPGQISSTWSINQLAYYYATQQGDFGKAAALSLALLLVGLVVALFVIYRTKFYRIDRGLS